MTLDPKKLEAAPDYKSMTGPEFLTAVGFDGQKWADAFTQRFPEIDHGGVLGWFCNAIMAGYDEADRRARAEIDALKAELARFQWRPIEEAPKDGTPVLLVFQVENWEEKKIPVRIEGRWSGGGWALVDLPSHGCGCCGREDPFPIAWMPIPTTINPSGSAPAGDVDDTNVVEMGGEHGEA